MLNPNCFAFSNSAFLSCGYKTSDRARQKMVKGQNGDLLRLCHTVPLEVLTLGGSSSLYYPVHSETQILFAFQYKWHTLLSFRKSTISVSWHTLWLRWKGLRSCEGRLLWLWGMAAVLQCGWNEIYPGPQWQNYMVQREFEEIPIFISGTGFWKYCWY